MLLLRTAAGTTTTGVQLTIDGQAVSGFSPDPALGNLAAADISAALANRLRGSHAITIDQAGGLARTTSSPGDIAGIDDARLQDVLLYLEYVLA